ncbi:SDR family oxidoreductase [Nocardiopsis ansamitocini]|uniref:dTDP-4-dehydrorhamnose reductase n=1 Tax=Nocardiopsis ansamitocini TaxID=1670832 RepID=A0A9W6P2J7_9ACTN|nr:SDR family oxidoreductase [Nocardiopsis ansamitocini]GLU45863.1 NAD(P)-dependent oxidoreductase [Nocardiopsis ansamitocini]
MARRILVTGAGGMLGSELMAALSAADEVRGWSYSRDRPRCRRVEAGSGEDVEAFFAQEPLDVCVHCVANADVQQCEDDPEMAHRVNTVTTGNVAQQCARRGVKLVYISTEYVFDGRATDGYAENDPPNPLQVYGETKRRGETEASRVPDHLIVRLPVLYGKRVSGRGPTWTESLLHTLRQGEAVELDDRFERQPTWTGDVAAIVGRLIAEDRGGIVHLASREKVTKYAWARKIAETAGLPAALVLPSYALRPASGAPRPPRPCLKTTRLEQMGIDPPAGVSQRLPSYLSAIGEARAPRTDH